MHSTITKDQFSEVKKNLVDLNSQLSKVVGKNPWPTMLGAAAIGFGVAFVGLKKLSALAVENKDMLNEVLLSEMGVDLNKIFDVKKTPTAVMPPSAIGA